MHSYIFLNQPKILVPVAKLLTCLTLILRYLVRILEQPNFLFYWKFWLWSFVNKPNVISKGIFGGNSQILQSVFFFNIVLMFISKFKKTLCSISWIRNLYYCDMNSKLFFLTYQFLARFTFLVSDKNKKKMNLMLPIFDHKHNFVAKNFYTIQNIRLLKSIISVKLLKSKSILHLSEIQFLSKAIFLKHSTRIFFPNGIFTEKLIIFWKPKQILRFSLVQIYLETRKN